MATERHRGGIKAASLPIFNRSFHPSFSPYSSCSDSVEHKAYQHNRPSDLPPPYIHPTSPHCHHYCCQSNREDKETTTALLSKIVTHLLPILERLATTTCKHTEPATETAVQTSPPTRPECESSSSATISTIENQSSGATISDMATPSTTSPEYSGNRPAMSAGPFGFVMTMPQPGTPGTPFFQGKNVSEFLSRYEDMCEDYHVGNNEKIRRLPRYCDMLIGQTVESLPDFVERRWAQLCKVMKKEYKAGDSIQQVNSRAFLESYKDKERTSEDDVRNFCRKFGAISKVLIGQEKLDIYTRNQWFLQGLPKDVREEFFFRRGVDFDDNVMKDFDGLVKKTLGLVEARLKYKEVMRTEKSVTDKYSALADQFDRKIVLDGHENIMNSLTPPVADSSTVSLSKSTEKAIAGLTERFDALVLMAGTQARPANQNSQQTRNRSQSPGRQAPYDGQKPNDRQYGGEDSCTYCGEKETHDRRRNCLEFDADQRNGVIHLNERGLLCLGPMGTYSNPIRHVPGVTQKESIRRAKMLANQFSHADQSADVHSVRIGEDSADEYSSDEEWDPEVTIIDTTSVNSARTEQQKPVEESWREPAKRILKRRAEREDKFAVPKAPRYGSWNPVPASVERRSDNSDQSRPPSSIVTDKSHATEPRVTFADPWKKM